MIDEGAHQSERHWRAFLRPDQQAGITGKVAVAGDAAEQDTEIDAGRDSLALPDRYRRKADVIGIFQHRHAAAAVETDVELARQAVELPMLQNGVVELATQRPRVDQLVGVDAGGGAAGDVAQIVGAGAPSREAEILDRGQHVEDRLRTDLAQLQVGPGGHVGIGAGVSFRDIGDAAQLMGVEDPVRDPQAAHEGVLRGRHIEQPVKLVQEDVGGLRKTAGFGVGAHLVPHVERVLGAFRHLLRRELLAGGEKAILRGAMDCFRTGRRRFGRHRGPAVRAGRGWRRTRPGTTAHQQTGEEAFEIALLLLGEVRTHFRRTLIPPVPCWGPPSARAHAMPPNSRAP